ncbi:MAG: sensor histidine kinase KdpD [Bradyrhizobium sp.]|nr:MAG: sensor histidine kinase KdpD [Bradyrhizobium sp.]
MANDRNSERRPDPDALLALAGKGRRGRLLVFLGAAPGVGKTYAMLQRAKLLRQEGVDVVVGLVETHSRAETEALTQGLEILPRRVTRWRDRDIEEFDLDAALRRHPKLIIVDELAHTNAPDSRHPKRWQDVEELLDARIDVWTALNIQHLDSLADIVSRIAGVTVRETVPDTVLRDADDIVLVDLTSEELIQRLKDGKVYLPETARLAQQKFFTLRNLTALREIALRRAAARVDDQMVEQLRQSAIEGPWETAERLLVCVGPDALSLSVVRAASRLATGLNASWVAATVDKPSGEAGSASDAAADAALRLAQTLGAETTRLVGHDLPEEILRYAQRENITQIVVGRSRAGFFSRLLGRSLSEALARRASLIGVHIVTGDKPREAPQIGPLARLLDRSLPIGALAAAASVAVMVGLGEALDAWLRLPNLSMIFLIAVVVCAARFGVRSAILAAVLSFLAYDFFFVPPLYQFTIAQPQEFFALTIFLMVASLVGWLAGRGRDQERLAREHAQATRSLFEFSRKLSGAVALADILDTATVHAQRTLEAESVVMLLPEEGELALSAAWPPVDALNAGESSAARWAFDKSEPSGWRTGTLPNVRFQFRPLVTSRGVVGVCGFAPANREAAISPTLEHALNLILEQTAIAADRALLVKDSVRTVALEENEKLRSTLLASLSHDLRTPLATITGAVTTLRKFGEGMSAQQRDDLLASIEEEGDRLTRFIANLLDMSRIEAGALRPQRDLVDVAETVRAAIERAAKAFPTSPIVASLAQGLPYARGDANLIEQVLFNLLDNAQKYGDGGRVTVHARPEGANVLISVTDEGPGIKSADLERIFEKFYRGGRPDGRRAGTGLGLSISRGLIEAMGGRIWAESPAIKRRGTRIVIAMPAVAADELAKAAS